MVRDCVIEGYQNSLYVQEGGSAWFRGSKICGNVDFIFGGATALFDRCEIRSRFVPGAEIQGYISAPSTPIDQPKGFVFDRCRLTREAGLPRNSVYLGRPWRAGGNMRLTGASVFLNCWMDDHIKAEGWSSMGYTNPAGVQTQLTLAEVRLSEFGSRGPGADSASPTRRLLSPKQAQFFDPARLFGDWSPKR